VCLKWLASNAPSSACSAACGSAAGGWRGGARGVAVAGRARRSWLGYLPLQRTCSL